MIIIFKHRITFFPELYKFVASVINTPNSLNPDFAVGLSSKT